MGLALLYGALAAVWFALHLRAPRAGLAFVLGPLLAPIGALGLIPLAYHTLLVSGPRAATFGMRAFDLQLRTWQGERPVFLQALAHAVLFYLTVAATGTLILLVALFSRRKRTLHDVLTGMLMVRGPARIGPPLSASHRP